MRKFSKKQYLAAGAAAVIIVGGAGTAFAYWSTTGSGQGTATTTGGTDQKIDFATGTLTAMFPGDSPQDLRVTVKNTSGEKAYVAGVTAYITTNKTGCTATDYTLGGSNNADDAHPVALAWTAQDLAAGGSDVATSTIQFNDKTDADQSACKGATVTLHYASN